MLQSNSSWTAAECGSIKWRRGYRWQHTSYARLCDMWAVLAPLMALLLVGAPSVSASGNVPVVGWLGLSSPEQEAGAWDAFRQGLTGLGHEEGRTLVIEHRWARGDNARFPALARDLLSRRPAVIFSPCGLALRAIRDVSTSVPVVAVCADWNNFLGEVATLNRPGGQTTGFTFLAPESAGKRLEILKELQPKLSRVAVLHSGQEDWPNYWQVMERVAPTLGLRLSKLPVKGREDLEGAIASAVRQRAEALVVLPDPITWGAAERIAALAIKHRLPTAFDIRGFVTSGGLFSYGPVLTDLYREVGARYIDKILKGATAGDLPVQQPTRFKLVVNLRTARAIGLSIPRALLARTDEVLE